MLEEQIIRESEQLRMVKELISKRLRQYTGLKYEELEILAIMLGLSEKGDENEAVS